MNGVIANVSGEICAAELADLAIGKSPYVVAYGRSCVTWVDQVLSKIGQATAVDPNGEEAVVTPYQKGSLFRKLARWAQGSVGRRREDGRKIVREIKLTSTKNARPGDRN